MELGRKGGRSKRQVMLHDADPLPALDSAESVRNFIARLTAEVYSGEKHPSLARGLAALLLLQLRLLHDADVEERLAILEEKVAKSDKISCEPEDLEMSAKGGTGGGSI